jgi:omega-6 fatty acid desaturase (delta-12 desaturase)
MDNGSWKKIIAPYQTPDARRSWWQVITSLVPFFILWVPDGAQPGNIYWLTLLLAIPAAGFMARLHHLPAICGHGSFFVKPP